SLRHAALAFAAILGLLTLTGCGDERAPGDATGSWSSEEEQRGDTTIVRTFSGSVWGDTMTLVPELVIGELDGEAPYVFGLVTAIDVDSEGRIYVADRQAAEVRVFDRDGRFLRVIGSRGDGPGEYQQPDHLRITSNDEIVVRDQQGGRFVVFSTSGEYLRSWRLSGNFFTSQPFHLDAQDRIYNPDLRFDLPMESPDRQILVQIDAATGQVLDTLLPPRTEGEPGWVELRIEDGGNRMVSRSNVPFIPTGTATLTPEGGTLRGLGSRYALHLERPDGSVLAIERAVEPVPVRPAEAAAARQRIEEGFRAQDASWRWNGPQIPAVKPPFRWAGVGRDGTLWVQRHTPAREIENPDHDPSNPSPSQPRTHWEEKNVMDVFDPEGRYLGPIEMPSGFSPQQGGVLTTDELVVMIPHELGYHQVARYRVAPRSEGSSGE
ncbi:MAG: 6-bladed beta-propeller, partial [Gemmatimonadales bacterium]